MKSPDNTVMQTTDCQRKVDPESGSKKNGAEKRT